MSTFLIILIISVVLALILTGMAAAEDGYMAVDEFFTLWAIASAVFVGIASLIAYFMGAFDEPDRFESTASSRSGMGGDRVIEEIVEETRVEEAEVPRETATRQFDFGFREIEAGNFGGEK